MEVREEKEWENVQQFNNGPPMTILQAKLLALLGQAHDMFSRIFQIRIYEFFDQWEICVCFQLRTIGEKYIDSYSKNSWKHVVSSILVSLEPKMPGILKELQAFVYESIFGNSMSFKLFQLTSLCRFLLLITRHLGKFTYLFS